jgi:hypothetical protein
MGEIVQILFLFRGGLDVVVWEHLSMIILQEFPILISYVCEEPKALFYPAKTSRVTAGPVAAKMTMPVELLLMRRSSSKHVLTREK